MTDAASPRPPDRGIALLERRSVFEPDPASAAAARRLLREVLSELDRTDWSDLGELAISEVVTNASLHAHTPIEVHVEAFQHEVCVEVRDYNPILPVQRDYDEQATTGRGMGLVATIATSCGIHSLGDDGKIVWFCVGDPPDLEGDDVFAAWDLDSWAEEPGPSAVETREVVLASMPAMLWLSARQHHDAIMRELVLYLAEHSGIEADTVAADRARTMISVGLVHAVEEARADGTARPPLPQDRPTGLPWVPQHLDLRLQIPIDAAPLFATMQDVLDTAEALAVDRHLFIRPGLPEIVAVRDWACEQVIAQLAGSPPAPWPGTAQKRFEVTVHDRSAPEDTEWDVSPVRDSAAGVIAADDANRIIAVSRPIATALGWEVDELVGRRVVAIVPPGLREAHVAGFSRYLSTGEAHIIGVPVDLPVLHRDGQELPCRILIERAPASGRPVYLAWIDPIERPST